MKSDKLKNLSKNILNNRSHLQMTQQQIAEKMNISYQAYQAYELGITVPTLHNFLKLCEIFDVTPNDLLDY